MNNRNVARRSLNNHLQGTDKTSLKKRAYESLKNWIIYTELKPGTPLNERELADKLGISRTPLREVLQRLSYQKLIIIHPRKGIFVAPIEYEMIRSIFEVRVPLERTAVALCAQRARDEDIRDLRQIIEQSYQASAMGDYEHLIKLDQRFHERIGETSRNPILKEMIEDLHNVCLRFWYLYQDSARDSYPQVDALDKIVTAIQHRNPRMAASCLSDHIMSFLPIFDQGATQLLKTLSDL